nr:hypothetical protein [Parabacteroides goldsteinii]
MANTLLLGLLAAFTCADYRSVPTESKPVAEEEKVNPEVLDKPMFEENGLVVNR